MFDHIIKAQFKKSKQTEITDLSWRCLRLNGTTAFILNNISIRVFISEALQNKKCTPQGNLEITTKHQI